MVGALMSPKSVVLQVVLLVAVATSAMAQTSVGKVTLSIGGATLSSGGATPVVLHVGADIHPGDRVTTGAGAHVHIRFVDGGLVSVRPHSNLLIEDYEYQPEAPSLSKVRFNLEHGTARSISGVAAEAAKHRFRLNTPLVAIGVRGTDFVVHSTDSQSTAAVNQGAIVVAPFSDGCTLHGVGSCSGGGSVLVTPQMGGLLAEYRSGQAYAQLRQLTPAELVTTAAVSGRTSGKDQAGLLAAGGAPMQRAVWVPQSQDGNGAQQFTNADNQNSVGVAILAGGGFASTSLPPLSGNAGAILADISLPTRPLPPALPDTVLPVLPEPLQPVLAWGRWGDAAFVQDFSQTYAEARQGREVTVANNTHVLYRTVGAFPFAGSGTIDFKLVQGHAQYKSPSHLVSPVAITGGNLAINFAQKNFDTSLTMDSKIIGSQSLSAHGAIDSDGIFRATSSERKIAGALDANGVSAGYLFDKAVSGGILSGITLWAK